MTDAFTISPRSKEFGPSPRWVRVYLNNHLIADSQKMMLLREADHLPLYYFPKKDVHMDCLQPSDHTTQSDLKGEEIFWVYPGFPTIFRGLSEFFVGDLMRKTLWKLVENAQRFPRRGGRVLCVHGPVSFHRARPCATKWPPRRGLRTGPPASSDCGRPVNDKCSHQHRRSVQAERSSCPGKTVISGTYAIWETRI